MKQFRALMIAGIGVAAAAFAAPQQATAQGAPPVVVLSRATAPWPV